MMNYYVYNDVPHTDTPLVSLEDQIKNRIAELEEQVKANEKTGEPDGSVKDAGTSETSKEQEETVGPETQA